METKVKDKVEKGIEYVEKVNEEKKNIPKEVKQEMLKRIFGNLIKAIGILVYFGALNLANIRIDNKILSEYIKICSGIFLISSIIVLEISYKKDDKSALISGIELLILSFHSLLIIHIITVMKYDFKVYVLTSSYIFTIYYVLKAIIVETKEKKKYVDSLSDIPEIVKKEEPQIKEAKRQNSRKNISTKKVNNKRENKPTVGTKRVRTKSIENEKEKIKSINKKAKKTKREQEKIKQNTKIKPEITDSINVIRNRKSKTSNSDKITKSTETKTKSAEKVETKTRPKSAKRGKRYK